MKLVPIALLAAATLARAETPPAPPTASAPSSAQASAPATSPGGKSAVTVRQSPPDDYTAAVVGYPLSMATLERYAAAVHDLRQETDQDPKLLASLRKQAPKQATLAESAARVERQPRVKAILDRHGLTGLDFVLVPSVVQATGMQLFAEQAGHPVPPDRCNTAFMALYKANREKIEQLWAPVRADLQAVGGR